jgi:hypothetical protein
MYCTKVNLVEEKTYQCIHRTSLLVMLETWPLFTRDIHKPWQLITISVKATTVSQEHLNSQKAGLVRKVQLKLTLFLRKRHIDVREPESCQDGPWGYSQARQCHQPWSTPLQVLSGLSQQEH